MRCNSIALKSPSTAATSKSPAIQVRTACSSGRANLVSITNIPKRRLGQNFLVDRGVVSRIIDAFDLKPDQTVMEIGPGRGALTSELNNKAGRVIAIEFDGDLAAR